MADQKLYNPMDHVTVWDPLTAYYIKPNSDGSINVTATGGGEAVTIADGADVTQGAIADVAYVSGSGTVVAVLKGIFGKLVAFVVGAGTAAAAQRITLASDDPAVATLGATTGAAVVTDANGTIQQYLRGFIKLIIGSATGSTIATYSANITTAGSGAGTGGVAVKASAGQMYGYYFYNTNASVAYVQMFDVAQGTVNLGTTVPKLSLGIPANGGANVNFPTPVPFATAITIAVTTTRAGSTATATGVDCNVYYC